MIYVTSDNHFGHTNIIRYTGRHFKSTSEMDNTMIKNWNKIVSDDDIIYHLGDFALSSRDRTKELLDILNGHKILIRGNHDRSAVTMLHLGFDEVYEGIKIFQNKILCHNPIIIDGMITLNVGVDQWNFTPIPMPTTKQIILCGHIHEKWLVKY